MTDKQSDGVLPALPEPANEDCWSGDCHWPEGFTADQMRDYARTAVAAALARQPEPVQQAGEAVAWEGCEGWEQLAWELCAEENGEESCNELIWEGGPIPEPWGDRWLKYEDEAKRLIKLVHKHASLPAPQVVQAEHAALMKFYGVDSLTSLIEAQAHHIEKLQAKLPRNDQPAFTRVREG